MNPATWHALGESLELGLLMLSQGIALLIGLASVLFIVLSLGGAFWGCCAQARRFARRLRPAPVSPEPDAQNLLLGAHLILTQDVAGETMCQEAAAIRRL